MKNYIITQSDLIKFAVSNIYSNNPDTNSKTITKIIKQIKKINEIQTTLNQIYQNIYDILNKYIPEKIIKQISNDLKKQFCDTITKTLVIIYDKQINLQKLRISQFSGEYNLLNNNQNKINEYEFALLKKYEKICLNGRKKTYEN